MLVVHGQQLVLPVSSVAFTEMLRGVLAPFGHRLWSTILGGIIFHPARTGHLCLTWSVLIAYIGVSILHAGFDLFGGITATS